MLSEVKELSLYLDTVGGQNRKQNVAAMFMYAIQTLKIEVISHNFLENRHSQMECDSIHSSTERENKYYIQCWTGYSNLDEQGEKIKIKI